MNFILVISICSLITGTCLVTGESETKYDTWNDCIKDAMNKSQLIIEEIPTKDINEMKLAISYSCYEKEKTKI